MKIRITNVSEHRDKQGGWVHRPHTLRHCRRVRMQNAQLQTIKHETIKSSSYAGWTLTHHVRFRRHFKRQYCNLHTGVRLKTSPIQCWSCAHTLLQGYTKALRDSSASHGSEGLSRGVFLWPLSVCAGAVSDHPGLCLPTAARAAVPGKTWEQTWAPFSATYSQIQPAEPTSSAGCTWGQVRSSSHAATAAQGRFLRWLLDAQAVALLHPPDEELVTSQSHQLLLPCSSDRRSSLHTLLHYSFSLFKRYRATFSTFLHKTYFYMK